LLKYITQKFGIYYAGFFLPRKHESCESHEIMKKNFFSFAAFTIFVLSRLIFLYQFEFSATLSNLLSDVNKKAREVQTSRADDIADCHFKLPRNKFRG